MVHLTEKGIWVYIYNKSFTALASFVASACFQDLLEYEVPSSLYGVLCESGGSEAYFRVQGSRTTIFAKNTATAENE